MQGMFENCSGLTSIDLSGFDTSNVTKMNYLFASCSNLTTIYASDKWNTEMVTGSYYMFNSCAKLKGDIAFNSNYTNKTYATTKGGYLTYKAATSKTLSLNINPNTGAVTSYDVFSSPISQFRYLLNNRRDLLNAA